MSQFDALAYPLALGTAKTATFHTTGVNLFNGNASGTVIWCQFLYDTVLNVSGNNYITFTSEWSTDNSSFTGPNSIAQTHSQSDVILTLNTVAQQGEAWLPVITVDQYIRFSINITGSGSTPSGNFGIRYTTMGGPRVP